MGIVVQSLFGAIPLVKGRLKGNNIIIHAHISQSVFAALQYNIGKKCPIIPAWRMTLPLRVGIASWIGVRVDVFLLKVQR